jgi:hypothetical protein
MRDAIASRLQNALIYEGEQAWTHYRHVESERNQHLGYLFTVIGGGLGLFVALIGSGSAPQWKSLSVAVSMAASFLMILGILIYLSIRKFGQVLAYYDAQMETIRASLFSEFPSGQSHFQRERTARQVLATASDDFPFHAQDAANLITSGAAIFFSPRTISGTIPVLPFRSRYRAYISSCFTNLYVLSLCSCLMVVTTSARSRSTA